MKEKMMKTTTQMTITETRDEDGQQSFDVSSGSGKTYHVRYEGSGDGDPDMCATWSCTCPAHRFRGGSCKHVAAVTQFCGERSE